ncbi:MAG: carbohydrate ABC transporter permease [Anaerolineae bacterium]
MIGTRVASQQQHSRITLLARERVQEALQAYLFLLPTLVGLLLFTAGAVIASFALSFTNYNVFTPPQWAGLYNYRTIVTTPLTKQVLLNTLYYSVVMVPASTVLALTVALAMNQRLPGRTLLRGMFFMPVISSTVAVALIWSWLYNPEFGLLNIGLRALGLKGLTWLRDTKLAMPSVMIMSLWKGLGYNMVIFLAGLQAIPEQLHEAAEIDGAGRWARLRHVTVPMLSPTIFLVLILSTIASFQVFEQTFILTNGGPGYATLTIALYIYQTAFVYFNMGYASALAYILFAAVLMVTLLQFRLQERWVFYG